MLGTLWLDVSATRDEFMSTLTFYRRVIDETGETNREAVKRGTAAVFHALRDRLTPEDAEQAVAQLPRDLKRVWEEGNTPGRKPIKLHRKEFYDRVKREAGLASVREARFLTIGVFTALKAQLSLYSHGQALPGAVRWIRSFLSLRSMGTRMCLNMRRPLFPFDAASLPPRNRRRNTAG